MKVFQQPHSRQEHLHDRRGHEPVAPAHDRRHDDPQVSAEDPARLHPNDQGLCPVPDTASFEDVRRFQLHLAESGAHAPILNRAVSALRFFFQVTLGRHEIVAHTTFKPR
jgi:hypothetical protein